MELSGRKDDPFFDTISEIMKEIETRMKECEGVCSYLCNDSSLLAMLDKLLAFKFRKCFVLFNFISSYVIV